MSARADIRICDDVAREAADLVAERVRAGGHIALSGGSTPKAAHVALAGMGLDWSHTEVWFGDERAVDPAHEDSNYRMARESLLDRLDGATPVVHRVRGEDGAEEAAEAYAGELAAAFGAGPPALDLVLLGIGPDGHTASLFPGKPAVAERERWAVAVPEAGMAPHVARVTLTLPVLDAAREVVFLIAGADKAEAVGRAFADPPDESAPAALVAPASGRLVVLCDAAAAAGLEGS